MSQYRVEVTYDMGMSCGGEIHTFVAKDDVEAIQYMNEHERGWLSPIKRDLHFKRETLSRVIETDK